MKIIVSCTTWDKRVEYINLTLDSIINQTLKPDSIELNLSEEEFPNKEQDFPKMIQDYLVVHNDVVNCNWVGKNTRTFKKIIPTLQKYAQEEEYLFLSVDDDCLYRQDYIQLMVSYLKKYNADTFCLKRPGVIGNKQIYKSSCFQEDFWKSLTDDIISYGIDDYYIEHYLKCKKKIMAYYHPDNLLDIVKVHNELYPLHDEYRKGDRIKKTYAAIEKINF